MQSDCPQKNAASTVAIIGGGLAGLAAAADAVKRGLRVELFEQARTLGGRASSFVDTEIGHPIDYCQHVAMGCCTAWLDFCRQTEILDGFERSDTLHFFPPDGRRCDFSPTRWLPAPFHLLPGLYRLKFLSLRERLGILSAMAGLAYLPMNAENERKTVGQWLREQKQSSRAIEWFWSVVLVSALGETIDRAALSAARKVFCDGFLASREASQLVLPRVPLGELFHDRAGRWLMDRGVTIHLKMPVRRIEGDGHRATAIALSDGSRREFDHFVVAVPWRNVSSLLAENLRAAMPGLENIGKIEPAAITAVHLWFDRPISPLPHAVLLGRLSQWVFFQPQNAGCQYCQVVISATHRLVERSHTAFVAEVCRELAAVWPAIRDAMLLHHRVITQPAAVFSVQPGVDALRLPQSTALENLALAGDWTATGWPGTMESAVRSGRLAIQSLKME
jgi:squalene-associated FAD-dependent desaturase